jgi:hypothetical protein
MGGRKGRRSRWRIEAEEGGTRRVIARGEVENGWGEEERNENIVNFKLCTSR